MKSSKSILSLEKALNIIEIMSGNSEPMRLQDIAEAAGIPASTALRLISTFEAYHFILQEPSTKRYYLSLKLFNIGSRVSDNLTISRIARPYLKELSSQLKSSVNLAIEQNMSMFVLDVVGGAFESPDITVQPGKKVPMYCTGLGKAMLSNYSEERFNEFFSATPPVTYTTKTITDKAALMEEMARIRKQGYAFDSGEYRDGIIGISAPILDQSNRAIASISVADLASTLTEETLEFKSHHIMNAAVKIAEKL